MSSGTKRRLPPKKALVDSKDPMPLGSEARGEVNVVFTTWEGTRAALRAAAESARALECKVVVLFAEVVPRQFALRRPPSSVEFAVGRLSDLATACCQGVEFEIRLFLCTNFRECLLANLEPHTPVFLGGRGRWWRTWEQKVAEFLQSREFTVLFVDARQDRGSKLPSSDKNAAEVAR